MPQGNLFIVCSRNLRASCEHCKSLPPERLILADFLHDKFNGFTPHMVRKLDGSFESFFEQCEHDFRPPPSEFSHWKLCLKCSRFFFRQSTDLQRHSHLVHESCDILELCASPFVCSFRLERPKDIAGIPFGPYEYCNLSFASAIEFKTHKDSENHKLKRKKKSMNVTPVTDAPIDPTSKGKEKGKGKGKEKRPSPVESDDENPVPQKRQRRHGGRQLGSMDDAIELILGAKDQLQRTGKINRFVKVLEDVLFSETYIRSYDQIKELRQSLNDLGAPPDVRELLEYADEIVDYLKDLNGSD